MEHKQTAEPNGRIALVALLVAQILLGYEWLSSGLTKLVRADFPGGLAEELAEKSEEISGWYGSFLDGTVIPHARAFGYLIEIGELAVGLALLGAAVVWVAAWGRLPRRGRLAVLVGAPTRARRRQRRGAPLLAAARDHSHQQREPTGVAFPERRCSP